MLVKLNVGSSLNPQAQSFEDNTLLRDVVTNLPNGAQLTLDGVNVTASDMGKTLKELNIKDGTHIIYNTKMESGKE